LLASCFSLLWEADFTALLSRVAVESATANDDIIAKAVAPIKRLIFIVSPASHQLIKSLDMQGLKIERKTVDWFNRKYRFMSYRVDYGPFAANIELMANL
jgi:hypothetical protein